MSRIPRKALEWARSSDTGVSSLTMFEVLSGREVFGLELRDIPSDPDDFGRCHRLLAAAPTWRKRLREVAERHPQWGPLVDHWDELERLYLEELPTRRCPKLYRRMQELHDEGLRAEGWMQTSPGCWEKPDARASG